MTRKLRKKAYEPFQAHIKIAKLVGHNKRVLDIGCGTGSLAKILTENKNEVWGIEVNQKAAEQAKKYCQQVFIADIENNSLSIPDQYFDIVIFADVLEHLKSPAEVLKSIRKKIKPSSSIIISIPNIANWRYRLRLLFGRFEYEDDGILDKEHLRFFTLASAKRMLDQAGLRAVKIDITPDYFKWSNQLGEKSLLSRLLQRLHFLRLAYRYIDYNLAKIFKGLLAFQFIIVAKLKD